MMHEKDMRKRIKVNGKNNFISQKNWVMIKSNLKWSPFVVFMKELAS